MSYLHFTKDGKGIPIKELKTMHLSRIIARHKRLAKDGLSVICGSVGFWDGCDADERTVYGTEALEYLNNELYENELKRRTKQ